jgi:hypothetical protein
VSDSPSPLHARANSSTDHTARCQLQRRSTPRVPRGPSAPERNTGAGLRRPQRRPACQAFLKGRAHKTRGFERQGTSVSTAKSI